MNAFLADASPNAFEKVVDGLLASPRYGERWGRHWLDVARYSDTQGAAQPPRGESPLYPYAWTYRDYVIKAFNDDLPYDQFIREQLAADRLDDKKNPNPASLAALGFLTLGDHFSGNRRDVINDRIDVTSKAFLGLTVSCARCHDHKFDPIPTADYYSLYGIFASSIEPAEKPIIAPPNAAHADYLVEAPGDGRSHPDALREQNIKSLFGDYQAAGRCLSAGHDACLSGSGRRICTKNGGDAGICCRTGRSSLAAPSGRACRSSGSGTRWRASRRRGSRSRRRACWSNFSTGVMDAPDVAGARAAGQLRQCHRYRKHSN